LVACNDDSPSRLSKSCYGLEAAWQGHPFSRVLDESRAVVIDDAIPVKDYQLHDASLDRSATRFMVACSAFRSASRLARITGSSAMTITSLKKASTAVRASARVAREAVKSPLSNWAWAAGRIWSMASASARSASSVNLDASTDTGVAVLFLRILPIRLFAAARLSASGIRMK